MKGFGETAEGALCILHGIDASRMKLTGRRYCGVQKRAHAVIIKGGKWGLLQCFSFHYIGMMFRISARERHRGIGQKLSCHERMSRCKLSCHLTIGYNKGVVRFIALRKGLSSSLVEVELRSALLLVGPKR